MSVAARSNIINSAEYKKEDIMVSGASAQGSDPRVDPAGQDKLPRRLR